MTEYHTNFHKIIECTINLMSEYFQAPIHFSKVIQISEPGRRNNILRLLIDNPSRGMPQSLILKNTVLEEHIFEQGQETEEEQFNRFAHDWAGLEFLTSIGSSHAPRFYCGSVEHKFILIEDLGITHGSLVGPLTRSNSPENRIEAENALVSYIQSVGKMHSDTAGKLSQFKSILNRINPKASHCNNILAEKGDKLHAQISNLIEVVPDELTHEIDDIIGLSQETNEFHVFLHGDICPDNVFFLDNKMHLIDFEFGDFGNALIDASYLRMHMPSCWCSKAIPIDIRDRMEKIYREVLKAKISKANDDFAFNKQLVSACGFWLLKTINQIDQMGLMENEWICPSGPIDSDSQWEPEKNAFRPRIISRLKAFIECASTTDHFPKLLQVSKQILDKLRTQWPEVNEIELFPVFKD